MSKHIGYVYWNREEKLKIVDAFFDKYGHGELPISITKAVTEVQKMLPEARQRTLKGPSQFLDLVDMINARRVTIAAEQPAPTPEQPTSPAPPAEPTAPPPPAEPTAPPEHVTAWVEPTVEAPAIDFVAIRATLSDMLSDLVAGVLVDSVKKLLTNGEIAAMLRSLQNGVLPTAIVEDKPRHNPLPPNVARLSKPTYLLCGFKPHQQNTFLQAFPDFHLKFWYAERPGEGMEVLRQKATNADAILFTMEATSHSAVAIASTVNRRIIRVTGGSTAMVAALERLREENVKKVG